MGKRFATTFIAALLLVLLWQWFFKNTDENASPPQEAEENTRDESDNNPSAPLPAERPSKVKPSGDSVATAAIQEAPSSEEVAEELQEGKEPTWPKDTVEFELMEGKYAVSFGDMILGVVPEDRRGLKRAYFEPPATRLWPSATIPYSIEDDTPNKNKILEAIDYFAKETPVRFVPRKEETDSIVFIASEKLCASQLGRVGGHQVIMVAPTCSKGDILHELMHSLGFVHEHSREDRDRFIQVMWANIQPDFYLQFQMVPDSWVHEYRGSVFDFDPKSIMLYPPTAFAKTPGEITLKSKVAPLEPSRDVLSPTDKERVYYLYGH